MNDKTLKELYLWGKNQLSGLESPAFDCGELCQKFLGADRKHIALHGEEIPDNQQEFCAAVEKRKNGYPLQYLLGYWYFMDMTLVVKDGVLVPREDTEVLVHTADKFIGDKNLTGIDLCSGTGAVALGITKICKNTKITAAELFDVPYACLTENIGKYGDDRVTPIRLDIMNISSPSLFDELDYIVSNPPYIESNEINGLQKEVQLEPHEALDGGSDGLDFYRFIVKNWSSTIKKGGLLAFEIGENQGKSVETLLINGFFKGVSTIKDANGLDRVVFGIKG